ncbi:hypothetical protein [Qipengyuania qiaonensis]|uniref:Uncharacterized protein n=1 Tax=Qipengyuania qiaonensis TaxID=2867240 RepID=A0ABS7J6E0_9SPHN|nr:hypothetical protein [Qipengyuania qiaonensis]MBX7482841.1 hypothetical protein [Qipengyuania qiaonensis]
MPTEVKMLDGLAQPMGEGVFVLCQTDAERGPQSVVVTLEDLQQIIDANEGA